MLQLPALLLSCILASTYAALFSWWQGRRLRDVLYFWLASAVGFASGHLVGERWGFIPWTVGQVHIIEASIVALLLLLVTRWLRQDSKSE